MTSGSQHTEVRQAECPEWLIGGSTPRDRHPSSEICRTPEQIAAAARRLVRERGDGERISDEQASRIAAMWAASEKAQGERVT